MTYRREFDGHKTRRVNVSMRQLLFYLVSRFLTTSDHRRRVFRIPGPHRRASPVGCFCVHRSTDGREHVAAVPDVRYTHGRAHPSGDGKALREQVCVQLVVGIGAQVLAILLEVALAIAICG